MKRFLIGALLVGAWANSAIAENYDWSGIYGGVSVGARWSDMRYDGPFTVDYWSSKSSGFTGGGFVGYNFSYGPWVFGPEVSAMFSDATGESRTREFYPEGRSRFDLRARATASVNGRLGYAVGPVLPYVTAGYSRAWYETDNIQSSIFGNYDSTYSFERNGWNIGIGTDWVIFDHVFARAEYRFIDLGKDDIGNGWSAKYRQHAATLGIGYKF
jgi:outer membrane immunogenic protein